MYNTEEQLGSTPIPTILMELAPSAYHLRQAVKGHKICQHCENDETVQEAMCNRLQGAEIDLYCSGMCNLGEHYQKCMNHSGDFVEKVYCMCRYY
jgi:hypothetical protein